MIFNSFINNFLRIYISSFPLTLVTNKMTRNTWITSGILTSCRHKRELYNKLKNNNNNATLACYYKDYSKILSKVIKVAKKMEYDKLILNSCNKAKTTRDIINKELGRNKKKK